MELGPFLEAAGKLGIAITMGAALWYFILSPRKSHDGRPRSSLLVPGWIHDAALEQNEALRVFYEKLAADREQEHDRRIKEWRGFRDEERARRIEAEADRKAVLEALTGINRDVALLLEIQQAAARDSGEAGAPHVSSP